MGPPADEPPTGDPESSSGDDDPPADSADSPPADDRDGGDSSADSRDGDATERVVPRSSDATGGGPPDGAAGDPGSPAGAARRRGLGGGDTPNPTDEPPPRDVLLDAIREPDAAAPRLPYVLTQLESDDRDVRLLAATACCLIATETEDEEVIEYLIRRLSDRLSGDEVSLELTTALDYLSSSFAERVEPILAEIAEEREDVPLPQVGNFTRSYYYGGELSRAGVGRLCVAGADTPESPRHTVADHQREEREQVAYERRRRERGAEDTEGETGDGETGDGDSFAGRPDATVRQTAEVSSIAVRSRFDDLHVRGQRHRGRYATTYETLVGEGSDQRAVALRLLHQPDPREALAAFDRELGEQLDRWRSVSDHDNVVTVFDWGVESQPWLATALVDEPLAERDRPSPETAVENALRLADAVSHLHGNDVVHGGLDSRTVVYPADRFDDRAEPGPLLNNVGLINVFRYYFDPADCLDPRYAAPEYFDDRFGRVDHATDIYQLGTVCYRLFTGRPPFSGEFEAVRTAVLTRTPPAPSAVVDGLPEGIDEVLAKTMAKQKLRRYETVEQFRGELASLADE